MYDYYKWLKSKQDEGCRGLKLRDAFEAGKKVGQRDVLEKAIGLVDFSRTYSDPAKGRYYMKYKLDQLAKEIGDE